MSALAETREVGVAVSGDAAVALELCRASIQTHSKSFALASKLLPPRSRDDAAVLYAWCRAADDAIDESPPAQQSQELARLRSELETVYGNQPVADPLLSAFRELLERCSIPRHYPSELLAGMAMDAKAQNYPDVPTLMGYCYRVASTVGLMMCHVIGLGREQAMRHAAHLGMAMQLTNVCRDVMEDWQRERLYLPDSLLERHGAGRLRSHLGGEFPRELRAACAATVGELLDMADRYYRSADRGMRDLPWRAAFGVRTARLVYADIGRVLRKAGCDVGAGRAIVSKPRKLFLVMRAGLEALGELPGRLLRTLSGRSRYTSPSTRVEFSHDILCS